MSGRAWLKDVPWELVVWQNEQLCLAKRAHHGPSSDGYEDCRVLWEAKRESPMTFMQVVDLCRRCHRIAPFTNYNGNTFAAIVRGLMDAFTTSPQNLALARSLAGHIVAGVAGEEETEAFRRLCESLGV
jgi:hypothetical protein